MQTLLENVPHLYVYHYLEEKCDKLSPLAMCLYKLQDTLAMQRGNYLSWQAFAKGHDLPRKHSEEVFGKWLQLCSTQHDPNSKKMHENLSPFAMGLE